MDGDDANVKVFCRVRPPNERERGVASSSLSGSAGFLARSNAASASALFAKKCVSVPSSDSAQQTLFLHSKHGPARTFTFDRVFGEQASQTDVFDVVGAPITQACLEGYNGTIFAYGQTGSGKTFTMQGPDDVIDAEARSLSQEQLALRGLVPRVIDYLFANAKAQDGEKNVQHTFACSFLEIYNERVYDLLDGGSAKDSAGLQLRENGRKGVHVEGLIESVVTSSKKAAELMMVGAQNRRVGQTSMNRESSRSHSVFILQLQSKEISPQGTKIRTSRFNLVDLAGSERQRSTDAAGERLKEAGGINKSLSALGNVILGLSEQSVGKHRHVHYRDSKLTFLLKDSLGGNSKTFMVATISPAEDSAFETLSTLKFAQRAKMIQNSAVVNEDSVGSALFLQEEVQRLRRQLQHAQQEIARNIPGSSLLLQDGPTSSEAASSQDSAVPSTQELGPCDPAVDSRFRELEESFATTAEKTDRLLRSCEYLQLQNGNFQALCAELKQNVSHLKMNLRLRGSEAQEYEPSADAIEWRMKYEEMEERFAELQDELQRSGVEDAGVPGKINSEVENLNMMVLALTKQLAFVLRDKHDLQDRLLENQPGKDESMEGPSSQEVVDADFSARLQEALKQQANEYQAKLDSVGSVNLCLEAKAAETAFELLQIKEREASWSVRLHDLERQVADSKVALQRSEKAQSTSQELLIQEKLRSEKLGVQLERVREGVRIEFEAALADAATSNRDLEHANKVVQHQLAAVTADLKQREYQVQEAEKAFAQLKAEMNHLEEANQTVVVHLGDARDELKEATLHTAHLRAEIADRDNEIDELKRSQAAVTEDKQVLEQKLQESSKLIKQLTEEAEAAARSHAESIESLKCHSQEEEQKLVDSFEKQLHVKEEGLQQLQAELEDHRVKADEADRRHTSLLEEKEASLAELQRQLDDQQQESKLALEDAKQKLSKTHAELSKLTEEKERVETERVSAVQEIERLGADVKKFQAEKDAMASEIQRLSERTEQLEAKASKLTDQNADLQNKSDQKEAQLSESEEMVKKFTQEVEELQQQIAVLTNEAADLRKDLVSAKEESRQAAITQSQQYDELASRAETIEELQQELAEVKEDLSTKLEKADGEIRDAEETASHQREEINMYKGIQSTLRDEVRRLEVDRLELTESLKTEQEAKQDVEHKFADARETWQDEKNKLMQSSQEAISALEKRVEELVLGGESLSAEKRELEHENEALKASISKQAEDLQSLKDCVADREDKIHALESSTAETQGQLAETVADLRSSVRDLQRQLVEKEDIASKQETELAEKDGIIDSLKERAHNDEAAWDVKVREYKAELEAAHGRAQAFEQLVAEKTAVFTEAEEKLMAEKRAVERKLEEGEEILAQQTEQLMQEIKQLKSTIEEKDAQLELANSSSAELKDRLERAVGDDSNAKVKELQIAMDELNAKHKLVMAENARLKEKGVSELKQKEEELTRRRAEVDAAEEQMKSDRRSLERAALAAESAKKEAEAKSVTLDMLGQTKRKFLTEKVKLQREIQTLTKKLETVSRENEKLVGHHNSRQKIQHHVKVKEENNRLIDQVKQLTEDKAKLQRSLEKLRKLLKEKENIGVGTTRNTPPSVSPEATISATKKVRRPSLGSASSATAGTAASAARAAARLAERGRPMSRSASPGPTKKRERFWPLEARLRLQTSREAYAAFVRGEETRRASRAMVKRATKRTDRPGGFSFEESPMQSQAKRCKLTVNDGAGLRSGLVGNHPLIVAAATMQAEALSSFELSQELDPREDRGSQVDSNDSDGGILDVWSPKSTEAQPVTILSPSAPNLTVAGAANSPAVELARSERRIRTPRTPDDQISTWYAEAFESDGYDSDALRQIAHLLPAPAKPAPSSPGVLLSEEALPRGVNKSSIETWEQEAWPEDVRLLTEQYNPSHWRFPAVSVGVRDGAGCGCEQRCNAKSCLNAKENRFCTGQNCTFAGTCGNSLREHPSVAIARSSRTGMRGLVATALIPAGEVIGEYLGHVYLFGPPCLNGPANEGFRMHLKTRTTSRKHVGIDALEMGGKIRLLNHACNPTARFHEVQTGSVLTVVAVTVRDVMPGEQVTVSYGDKLWFVCRCGWSGCQHRDIQHLPDNHVVLGSAK